MIDKYIILNRKPKTIITIFLWNIFLLTVLVIWCINTCSYQNFFRIHSNIIKINSYYYLEVLIPVKEVNKITKQKKLWIKGKEYNYEIINREENIIYKNNTNYVKIYLKVKELDKRFQVKGYRLEIKIKSEKKKIINILMNQKEETNE